MSIVQGGEGRSPFGSVTMVDTNGNILSRPVASEGTAGIATSDSAVEVLLPPNAIPVSGSQRVASIFRRFDNANLFSGVRSGFHSQFDVGNLVSANQEYVINSEVVSASVFVENQAEGVENLANNVTFHFQELMSLVSWAMCLRFPSDKSFVWYQGEVILLLAIQLQ